MRKVKDMVKPAGEQVILAHRLLKNTIKRDEYIMMSEDFFKLSGGIKNDECEARIENCEGVGKVSTMVYYPNAAANSPGFDASIWDKIRLRAKLGLFKRKEEQEFKGLVGL